MAINRSARTPATLPRKTGQEVTGIGRHDAGMTIDLPESTLISVNGVELEVFEAGRENAGRPIVLCHGWPEHAFSWRYQVPALAAAGYHVLVPNQRGYGNSSCPADVTDYDIQHLSGDLVALLDHYGYEDATFVGHDWGAFVVWGLTLLHPNRVNGVVALSVPYQERGDALDRGHGGRARRRLLLRPLQPAAGRRRRRVRGEHVPVPAEPVPEERAPRGAAAGQCVD
ncbi:alpha/beta fold hydrolase [Luedemannella flava]